VQEVQLARPGLRQGAPSTELTFDGPAGSAPDPGVWRHEVGGNGWGNGEVQSYTASTRNAHLDGRGSLVLTARKEPTTGPDGIPQPYSSARLSTVDKWTVKPGSYVEATIRAPVGRGVLPAFWLIGADFDQVGWPACGELDIMEADDRVASTVYQTMHFPRAANPSKDVPYGDPHPGARTTLTTARDDQPHRYGVYFDEDVVTFYVDRERRLTLTRQQAEEDGRTWPFAQPQHVVLNVAVAPDVHADLPASMTVSDLSVWKGGVPAP
jgi:beta-glucanase (GH16 family)